MSGSPALTHLRHPKAGAVYVDGRHELDIHGCWEWEEFMQVFQRVEPHEAVFEDIAKIPAALANALSVYEVDGEAREWGCNIPTAGCKCRGQIEKARSEAISRKGTLSAPSCHSVVCDDLPTSYTYAGGVRSFV